MHLASNRLTFSLPRCVSLAAIALAGLALAAFAPAGCSRVAPPSAWLPWSEPEAACVLTAAHGWTPAEPDAVVEVLLAGTTVKVARVTSSAARARAWYPLGPRATVQPLELEDHGVLVRGSVAALATALYATSAISMDGHLATTDRTHLQWDGTTPEGLQLSFGSPLHFTPVTASRVTRACELLSLDAVERPASGTRLTATAPGAMPMTLAPDRAIELHAAAGGAVIGTFEAAPPRPVAAVARAVGWLRIIATDDYDLDGWIDEHDAIPALLPHGAGGPGCTHDGPDSDPSLAPDAAFAPEPSAAAFAAPAPSAAPMSRDHARCTHEVRFAAGTPPRWIGLFRTGTPFAVLDDADTDAVHVTSVGSSIVPATPTSWLLRRADLTGCERSSR